jgi:hypothetical protein
MTDRTRIAQFVAKFHADEMALYQEYFPYIDDEIVDYLDRDDIFRAAVLMEIRKYTRKESA